VLGVITLIFFIQQFGTHRIGRYFGPFMFLWFLMLGVFGGLKLHEYPMIVKAFNPYYAVRLLIDYPNWFLVLGAVFLCTTGAEALYSDLGHCGKKNITVSWLYVKAMLIINYMGQGAYLISHIGQMPADFNPFYAIMPSWLLIFGIIMATGAAIIASQALISGCFTIFSEAVHLDFWPMLRIKYPSEVKGQLFIPIVNNALYLLCVITVLAFQTSGRMEAAYGLAITITMLATTLMLSFYLHQHGAARWIVYIFASVYFVIEGSFLLANLSKFAHGGWFTLMLAGLFSAMMLVWYKARLIRLAHLGFLRLSDYFEIITDIKADSTIVKYASNLVYINRSDDKDKVEDKFIYSIINKSPKRADHYWLIHFERLDEPETLDYTCDELIQDTLYRINIRIGFRIDPLMSLYLRQIINDLIREKGFDLRSTYPALRKRNIMGDFRFVVIHRIYYPSSVVSYHDNAIMKLYSMIKHIGVSEQRAFGLDTSNVTVENVPLIISNQYRQKIVPRKVEE
jgi:KUP system potassium uptake protein